MLALAAYGLTVVPFSPLGLGLLLAGIALLTLDVRLRRLGPLTVAGMLAFVAGSVLVFGGVADEIDVSPWLIGSFSVAALLYWGFGLTVAMQSRDRLTSTQRGLVGLVGEARGELKPDGPGLREGGALAGPELGRADPGGEPDPRPWGGRPDPRVEQEPPTAPGPDLPHEA